MLEQNDLAMIRAIMKEEIDGRVTKAEDKLEEEIDERVTKAEGKLEEEIDERVTKAEGKLEEEIDERVTKAEGKLEEEIDERVTKAEDKFEEKLHSSENIILDEVERVHRILEKQIAQVHKNLDELNQYYRITKLENDNTSLLLKMVDGLAKRLDELEKKTA